MKTSASEMYMKVATLFGLLLTRVVSQPGSSESCKCTPEDACWPSEETWQAFNQDVGGNLIKNEPIASSCYPGIAENRADCDYVVTEWPAEDFQTESPIGRVLPYNISCPPVDYKANQVGTSCSLGINPGYAVNATTVSIINATMMFAQQHNIRLVVTGIGHDLLGRSDGFGGLEVWLRHHRNSISFQKVYTSTSGCADTLWNGSAIHIDGNYQWRDVSAVARENNVIVATGGTPSVGAIGGWPSGGGHGPATSALGFGSDQILEAQVLLASGQIVTANGCENADLYRSLRGGGPGYGIVLSMSIKAHPNYNAITAHHLTIVPKSGTSGPGYPTKSNSSSALLDAVTVLLQSYPDLIDAGVGGYTYWYNNYPEIVVGNSTTGYTHGVWTLGQNETAARAALEPVVDRLRKEFGAVLSVEDNYATYSDYWSFYDVEMNLNAPESSTLIMSSRMIERDQVADFGPTRDAVDVISDAPGQYNSQCVLLTGGAQVIRDGADPFSGLHPGWRRASYAVVTVRKVPLLATTAQRTAIEADMLAKGAAMQAFAPGTGSYMNEADRNDPDYIENFYGDFYDDHLAVKRKYDPDNHFYCPTCVGAEAFLPESPDGPLCLHGNSQFQIV